MKVKVLERRFITRTLTIDIIDKSIEELIKIFTELQSEYGSSAILENDYDDELYISYKTIESDDEYNNRLAVHNKRQEKVEAREMAELRRLKEKYGM